MPSTPPASSEKAGTKAALALDCVEVLGTLAALFEERRRQLADGAGLTVQQWQALEQVQHEHFMPSMFAQARASSAAAVSKILRQLTDKGLIVAHVSNKDARQRDYEVTPKGKEILSRVRAERQRAIDEVWMKLTREQLDAFLGAGSQLAHHLNSFAEQAR